MAELPSDAEPTGLMDPAATFEKMQDLLKAKDDTSRFVGLALLKSILDNEKQLTGDPQRMKTLWAAISPKFLDRLLRAQLSGKVGKAEAKDMVDLAVAVLHTFSILLPEDVRRETLLVGRTLPLVKALLQSPPETTELILQTLLTIVSQVEGSLELMHVDDISPLTEIASQHPRVFEILSFMWSNASTVEREVQAVRGSINAVIAKLIVLFKATDAVTFMSFVALFVPKLAPEALPQNPKWLAPLTKMLRSLVTSRPTLIGRAAYTQLAAALLQVYPTTCPNLLFKDEIVKSPDNKPFSYLFVNLLLIDLRSSFPSLLAKLNSDEYVAISQRLAAAFDVVSSFIGFLVRSLDDESGSPSFSMPPDLLLKLRKDLAETISLTIEYMRDRWDASIAGASGLHPEARAGTAATSEGTRLTLTWESMKDNVETDPLILAGLRTLAIWIREDENENLRNESAGLMDMLLELYKTSFPSSAEFKYPILLALEVIITTDAGVDAFLAQDGWPIIFTDLTTILQNIAHAPSPTPPTLLSSATRGLQIIRVLLAIIDHESTTSPHEAWMSAITTTAALRLPTGASPPAAIVELHIAMLQLSTALLAQAADGMQKRYVTSSAALAGYAKVLGAVVRGLDDRVEAADLMGLLDDVSLELENLRFR